MAGVLPATLRAVAAQRSNPLPADLSYSESAHRQTTDKTKARSFDRAFSLLMLAVPYSHMGRPTLPSALRRFTSEFGMGSGGTTALVPPANSVYQHVSLTYRLICIRAENSLNSPKHLRRCKVKPHGSLVPVSSTHRCAYTPAYQRRRLQRSFRRLKVSGELISGQVSCLDAFSTYLFRI